MSNFGVKPESRKAPPQVSSFCVLYEDFQRLQPIYCPSLGYLKGPPKSNVILAKA